MKLRMLCASLIGLALVMSYAAGANAADEKKEFKASCPLSGKPAKESASVKFNGKKVYFCCNNCPKAFTKKAEDKDNPLDEKLLAKVHHQWVQTGQAMQVGCPFSGKEVASGTEVAFNGAKVGFCCKRCMGKFAKAEDDKKLAMAFGKKFKGFTTQTKCPVSGKPIDAEVNAEHKGTTVYFCCPGCTGALEKDPDKVMATIHAASLNFKSGSCCDKSQDAGKACSHGCCAQALAAGKACSKCNG